MPRTIELAGLRFGRLTVLARSPQRSKNPKWTCRCDCGTAVTVRGDHLREQRVHSCGCYRREKPTTHGRYATPEYRAWINMRRRCEDPNNPGYHRYGARGISVHPRWRRSFATFFADMGSRPSQTHSLDRIDNQGPYSPANCRWATPVDQSRNQRKNRMLTFRERTMSLAAWAEETGLSWHTLAGRLKYGWTVERALTTPVPRHG